MKDKPVSSRLEAHLIYQKIKNKWHCKARLMHNKKEAFSFGIIRDERHQVCDDMRTMMKAQRRKIVSETVL